MKGNATAAPVRAFDRAYINGKFVTPHGTQVVDLVNPACCRSAWLRLGRRRRRASAYARITEFLGLPYMQTLRWLRVPGDTLFALAALVLVAFVFAGRSGDAMRAEEPLPDAVRVPTGD